MVLAFTFAVWALMQSAARPASDALAAAKALYAVADYDEALKALAVEPAPTTEEIEKYRALCLLALGRMDELDRQLEALVVSNPSYRMSDADVTPRLVTLFQQTRRRLLPEIVRKAYAQAKGNFAGGRYGEAASQLRALVALLDTTDGATDEDAIVARDMKRVAQTFLTLSEEAQAKAARGTAGGAPAGSPHFASDPGAPPSAALTATTEEDAIAQVVQQYVVAYSALDADRVARIFPGENPNPLRAAFDALKSQKVQARNVRIAVEPGGWSATVKLLWDVEAMPKVGSPRKTQMPATLRMLKVATGDWCIVGRY
jgi:ketosteroid isomerase-like protein